MAISDFGYGGAAKDDGHVPSLETLPYRGGMHIRPSDLSAGFRGKLLRLVLSSATFGMGLVLYLGRDAVVAADAPGAQFIGPIGLYMMVAAVVWVTALLRRPKELIVDGRNRVLHLVRVGWAGAERSRRTIRFEEIRGIELIDHVPTLDMQAHSLNWNMGRIDVKWQKSRTDALLVGDVTELEDIAVSLRRSVGLS